VNQVPAQPPSGRTFRYRTGWLIAAAWPLPVLPLVEYAQPAWLEPLLWMVLPIALLWLIFVVIPVFLLFRELRAAGTHLAVGLPIFVLAVLGAAPLRDVAYVAAFERLADASKPLVAAIAAYEARHGAAPESLHALVPEFLEAVPQTGLWVCRDYGYRVGTGNQWILEILVPRFLVDTDRFLYSPRGDYVALAGGRFDRIGAWAYVHD
jgi:hypothetical protein